MSTDAVDPDVLNPIAISWPDRKAPDFWAWSGYTRDHRRRVTKIVLGPSPKGQHDGEKDGPFLLDSSEITTLLAELRGFPNLTHLYLWNLGGLKVLPDLKLPLRCLDLRGCADLERIEGLPESLETLDLGGCGKLTEMGEGDAVRWEQLRGFHIDDCVQLRASGIQRWLDRFVGLERFEAKGCVQLREVEQLPASLKRLGLAKCVRIERLPDLRACPKLEFLNLNDCRALSELSAMNVESGQGLKRLLAHGCDQLRSTTGLDLRPVHLSSSPTENVAGGIRTLQRLADTVSDLVMAKLLLLGSGRCGKTTLAKALQWAELSEAERGKRQDIDPAGRSESTHGIQFWSWKTRFMMPGSQSRPEPGRAHIWDFGGQEIYHNTHRLFATEGSVFVLVTTSPREHARRVEADLADLKDTSHGSADAFRAENEYREIKYWLDYLRSVLQLGSMEDFEKALQGRVRIHVLFNDAISTDKARNELLKQAGGYAPLLKGARPLIGLTVVNLWSRGEGFGEVLEWVKSSLGDAADGFGTRVPGLYERMSLKVEEAIGAESGREILEFEEWEKWVEAESPVEAGTVPERTRLRREQAEAVLRYLHNCGRVFRLARGFETTRVILKQQWAADLIYTLTDHTHAKHFQGISSRPFAEADLLKALEKCRLFRTLEPDRKQVFLDLLNACEICVRVANGHWIALQRQLLPAATADFQKELARIWEQVRVADGAVNHSFAIHGDQGGLLGNSDFRGLVVAFAREMNWELPKRLLVEDGEKEHFEREVWHKQFSHDARFWADGFQLWLGSEHGDASPAQSLVLRVEWCPREREMVEGRVRHSYDGGLFVQLLSTAEDVIAPRLRKILFEGVGPLALFRDKVKDNEDTRPTNLSVEEIGRPRGEGAPGWRSKNGPPRPDIRFDVAISYRSEQETLVKELAKGLQARGIHYYRYVEDDRLRLDRSQDGSRITDIYDYLKHARILIVVASREYFETPDLEMKRNLYCPVELADAVGANRPEHCLFWLTVGGLSAADLEKQVPQILNRYFTRVSRKRAPQGLRTGRLLDINKREYQAMEQCTEEKITQFLNAVGRNNTRQILRTGEKNPGWLKDLLDRIQRVLDGRKLT